MDLNEKYGQNSQRLTSFSGLRSLFIILQFQNTPCLNYSFSPPTIHCSSGKFQPTLICPTILLVSRRAGNRKAICAQIVQAMAPHSSTLAQKTPWMEEPGRLQSMGSLRVGHDLSDFTFTFHFHALEKEMATHSSILAWRIPGMEEPSGLPSMGSHRIGHD